jgi:hypothetical protein
MLAIAAAVVLAGHGLIHVMGAAVYLKLATIEGLAYRTTVLNGHVDLGERGMAIFGALWLLPTAGFVVAAIALAQDSIWWKPLLLTTTLGSVVLTGLAWNTAFAGVIVNTLILAFLGFGPRFVGWLSAA